MSTNESTAKLRKFDTRRLVTMGMLCALGVVLMLLFRLPLIPAAPFLEYDPADIPILIGTLIYGPVAGLIMTVVVSAIQATLVSASSGVIGFVMHVTATGAMCLVVGAIYSRSQKNLVYAVFSLLVGVLTMTVVMIGMNLILTPIFMGVGIEVVLGMLIPAIIPFNLLKAGINSIFAFLVFKQVERLAVKS